MENQSKTEHPLEQLKKLGKQRLDELKALGDELFTFMPPKDLATILFPPALGLDILSGLLKQRNNMEHGFDPNDPDEDFLRAALNMARWWSKHYFKTTIHGIENFPASSPCLLTGNHSAGLMPLDALFAMNKIRDTYGNEQIVHPLVHDFAYVAPRVARSTKKMGILRANKETSLAALKAGRHVLVYPGGDEDAFRTYKERSKIILAGRKGFIRLALRASVPIVPLVSVGLHESFLLFYKGDNLASKLGIKDILRTNVMPLALSFPWGLAPAFFPFLPLPTSIEMKFCEPIEVTGDPDDQELVDRIYTKVESAMQTTMDELHQNRVPLFGR